MTNTYMQGPLRPIKTEEEHEKALARVSGLMSAKPDSPEAEELEVLSLLIEAYEKEHYKIDAPSPVMAILFRMEQENLSRKDLEPIIGTRARVSEVLSGKRNLTIPMIRGFKTRLGISADVLIGVDRVTGRFVSKKSGTGKVRGITKKTGAAKQPKARAAS